MAELVQLRNNTSVAQSVVYNGRQIVLDPRDTTQFVKEVADKFIEMRSPLVSVVEQEVGGIYSEDDNDLIWLANFTGNPDASGLIDDKKWIDKRWQTIKIPNPNKEPRELTHQWDPGQETYIGKDGTLEGLNLSPVAYVFPPYQRRLVPSDIANWALKRDSLSGQTTIGALRLSRAKSNFEPDMSWTLNDMRSYLRLIDPQSEIGPSEEEVRRVSKKDSRIKNAGEEGFKAAVEESKRLLFKRVYFRAADPRYSLPSQGEFLEFVRGEVAPRKRKAKESDVMGMIDKSNKSVAKAKKDQSQPAA